jgi:hypothetical protein
MEMREFGASPSFDDPTLPITRIATGATPLSFHFNQTDRLAAAQRNVIHGCGPPRRPAPESRQQRLEEFVLLQRLAVSPVKLNAGADGGKRGEPLIDGLQFQTAMDQQA